jgi:hypothetical protein
VDANALVGAEADATAGAVRSRGEVGFEAWALLADGRLCVAEPSAEIASSPSSRSNSNSSGKSRPEATIAATFSRSSWSFVAIEQAWPLSTSFRASPM